MAKKVQEYWDLKLIKGELDFLGLNTAPRMTIKQYFLKYLIFISSRKSETTVDIAKGVLRKFHLYLDELNIIKIDEIKNKRLLFEYLDFSLFGDGDYVYQLRNANATGLLAADCRNCFFENPGFFLGDFFNSVAKDMCVVKFNFCNQCKKGVNNIRRVKPSAQPGLNDRYVHSIICKVLEGCSGDQFKEGRRNTSFLCSCDYAGDRLCEVIFSDHFVIDDNSFTHVNEVW